MRDATRELADRVHLLRLPQLLFHAPTVADIENGRYDQAFDARDGERDPHDRPIVAPQLLLAGIELVEPEVRLMPPLQLFAARAHQSLKRRVRLDDATISREQHDADGRMINHSANIERTHRSEYRGKFAPSLAAFTLLFASRCP